MLFPFVLSAMAEFTSLRLLYSVFCILYSVFYLTIPQWLENGQ